MARIQTMPQIIIPADDLKPYGITWKENGERLSRTPPNSSMQLGVLFDSIIGNAMAKMLGDIPVEKPGGSALVPANPDCVEVGDFRVVGGVRPQNFDVGYRPDGVRIAFDSKTLNDADSIRKNYQNMINDLGTEATTVHTRFPYAVVCFLIAVPTPCIVSPQKEALTQTLERLSLRSSPLNSVHKAEAISLILWNPDTGEIDNEWPLGNSTLSIEKFSQQVEKSYVERYKGLPPHV